MTSLQSDQTVAMACDSGMISFHKYEDLLIITSLRMINLNTGNNAAKLLGRLEDELEASEVRQEVVTAAKSAAR
jgi:hypothetical protein